VIGADGALIERRGQSGDGRADKARCGGVAAMEVLARDLKALGLYAARSLSYEGVEYELVEHQLTPEQIRIYDAYAGAFSIIISMPPCAPRISRALAVR
jgi:hypothetical protein